MYKKKKRKYPPKENDLERSNSWWRIANGKARRGPFYGLLPLLLRYPFYAAENFNAFKRPATNIFTESKLTWPSMPWRKAPQLDPLSVTIWSSHQYHYGILHGYGGYLQKWGLHSKGIRVSTSSYLASCRCLNRVFGGNRTLTLLALRIHGMKRQ